MECSCSLLGKSNLYNGRLHSTGFGYGYPPDMVTIAHAGPVVSKTLATSLVTAMPLCLRELHHIHPQPNELIREMKESVTL